MSENEIDAFTSLRVRPYLLTGGRTRSAVDLPMEALVQSTPDGTARLPTLDHERRRIVQLCGQPQSIAEVSAHLNIHLQVARVLVGDLVSEGLVATHTASTESSDRPDLQLLERVLDGLQTL
ncbi:MAG: hypothetical protein ACI8TP_001090 [Acidimicrobiales bacterium]|jgi:hypothetical protein